MKMHEKRSAQCLSGAGAHAYGSGCCYFVSSLEPFFSPFTFPVAPVSHLFLVIFTPYMVMFFNGSANSV